MDGRRRWLEEAGTDDGIASRWLRLESMAVDSIEIRLQSNIKMIFDTPFQLAIDSGEIANELRGQEYYRGPNHRQDRQ
jgi:hypothetical protein